MDLLHSTYYREEGEAVLLKQLKDIIEANIRDNGIRQYVSTTPSPRGVILALGDHACMSEAIRDLYIYPLSRMIAYARLARHEKQLQDIGIAVCFTTVVKIAKKWEDNIVKHESNGNVAGFRD